MFMSEYQHTLDAKGRVIIPLKFREQLGEEFVIAKGLEKCLFVYSKEEWDKFTEKLSEIPQLSNGNGRKLVRYFISGASECEIDKQGRILIPATLRNFADLSKDVTLAGVGKRIEIWDRTAWEEYNNFDDIEGLAESLVEYSI